MVLCVVAALLAAGCGSSPPVAPVRGEVTLDGRPLRGGAVVFTPLAHDADKRVGKSAYGEIRPDGTFALGTFSEQDGAIIGTHRATIIGRAGSDDAPSPGITKTNAPPTTKPPFDMVRVTGRTFDVVAGQDNEFTIELSSGYVRQFAQRGN